MAKFRGDRPRELGDYALKKKKNITGKTEDLPYYRTGRSNNVDDYDGDNHEFLMRRFEDEDDGG